MKEYKINGKVVDITLDNGKVVKASTKYLEDMVANLNIDMEEAVLTWLEDEEYIINEDQVELDNLAKENKSHKVVNAKTEKPVKKTPKERVQKAQPEKEYIVGIIAEFLEDITDISNLNIENKAKLITFTYKNEEYKLDLVQKRKKKGE
jgi:hypothetical protein